MKKILFILSVFVATSVNGQGIEFFHGTWSEALEKASIEQKLIFVDAYAQWCGPCKRMAKNEFTKESVGSYYNETFINVKMDMEAKESIEFRKKFKVSAYPTLFFINNKEEEIMKIKGAQTAENLLKIGSTAAKKNDNSGEFALKYEAGDRSAHLILDYISALKKAGKSASKITNSFLRKNKGNVQDSVLKIIMVGTSEADSKVFDLLVKNRAKIEQLFSKDEVQKKILSACYLTSKKAIEYQMIELKKEAKTKVKKYLPNEAKKFSWETDLAFYLYMKDATNYLKCCKDYIKNYAKSHPEEIIKLSDNIYNQFHRNQNAMKKAEKFAAVAVKRQEDPKTLLTYAKILKANGKQKDAIKYAKKGISMNPKKEVIRKLNKIIE